MKGLTQLSLLFSFLCLFGCSYLNIDESTISVDVINNEFILQEDSDSKFYYYYDEKLFLTERKDLLLIEYQDTEESSISELISAMSLNRWRGSNNNESVYEQSTINSVILQQMSGSFSEEEIGVFLDNPSVRRVSYLLEHNGCFVAETNQVLVKLKKSSDYSKLEKIISQLSCEFIDNQWLGDNVYLIAISPNAGISSIDLSNLLIESGEFESASPDFLCLDTFTSNDTYYSMQWGLWNRSVNATGVDINIENAWAITEGSNDVRIAILDSGVEMQHPDLQYQCVLGYSSSEVMTSGYPFTYSASGSHGTAVAGIIGAIKDNNVGIAGVAPDCELISVNVANSQGGITTSSAISAINFAVNNDADVINCSWTMSTPSTLLSDAIFDATENGREGKGCVFVFASGNHNVITNQYQNFYPAILHYVIAVGSHNQNGLRSDFSNYGYGLDVVAPGEGIVTTDLLGNNNGANNHLASGDLSDKSYTRYFLGTSAAAPFVSGIAALILSKYPDLEESQVRRAIELSCVRPASYSYESDNEYPSGLWNDEVGYGRVNAYAALQKAGEFNQQNIADMSPGIDFIITNNSSYEIDNIYVGLNGDINGNNTTMFSYDLGGVYPGEMIGYPVYRGDDIDEQPGLPISDVELEFWAESIDYSGSVRIGVSIDDDTPNDYYTVDLNSSGSVFLPLPDTTVPNGSRRTLYINIINPL